jgi:hypothetical protein
LKTQRQAWEEENRKALIQIHGCVYSLCVVSIMPLHIFFLLRSSFICCVCGFMEELKPEGLGRKTWAKSLKESELIKGQEG